jgi:outer membrane lipoprotein-sorting protein
LDTEVKKPVKNLIAPRTAAIVGVALCLTLTPALPAQTAYTLDQVFAKMDAVAKTFRSVQADTERTHVTILVNDKDVSSGKFYYVRQGKEPRVRLDLLKPSVQQLLIDKGRLQLYVPNLKQVQEASLGEHRDVVELIMALGFGQSSQDLKQKFAVSLGGEEVIDGKKTTKLELTPKNSTMFKSVQMWMDQDKWVAVQIRTTEASGDYLIVKFSNIRLNPNIPESVFTLKLPKDVKVVKR